MYEGTERRRKPRRPAAIPVRVRFTDPRHKPSIAMACTLDISSEGARISLPGSNVESGEVVHVERGKEKSMFRIAWVGEKNTPRQGQIGIQCVEPGKDIWQDKEEKAKKDAENQDLLQYFKKRK